MNSMLQSTLCGVLAFVATVIPASAESCNLFGKIKSKNSSRPVTITFINRTDALRNVTWLDFKGKPVDYAHLQPGEKFTINTFITHPWMFTDGPRNCHEIFMPKKNSKSFRITVERQDLGEK